MSPRRATNKVFAHSLLSNSGVALGPTTTSFSVVDGSQFPDTANGKFTIRFPTTGEVCRVNTRVSNAFTSVTRGLPEGAAAVTVSDGVEIDEIWGAQDIADVEDYVPPIDGSNITSGTISSARLPANVSSVKKAGASALTGDVTLTGGTNVTLTQSGNDISIAATGGGGGSGTVTSVGLSLPADFTVTVSPVTGSGTLTATWTPQSANAVLIGPATGSPASPTFRLLVGTDLPLATTSVRGAVTLSNATPIVDGAGAIGTSTAAARADHVHPLTTTFTAEVTVPDLKVTGLTGSVQASRYVGMTASGAPTTGPHLVGDAALSLSDATWHVCTVAGTPGTFVSAAGSGTVTSVGLTVPGALLGVSGSPITSSGTLAVSLLTQSANTVLAGPTSGSAATPTMRALVTADLPVGVTSGLAALNSQALVSAAELPAGSIDIDPTVLEGDLIYRHVPTSVVIGFIGDSITHQVPSGGNAPPTNVATDLSSGGFTATVNNQAIGGTRTVDWLIGDSSNNLVNAMAAFAGANVTVVHVMLGTNDSQDPADLVSAATYKANIAAICASLNAAGYIVVLSYPPYTVPGSLGLFTSTSNTLQVAYQGAIDQLVNGTTIRQGDVNAYAYFQGHTSELSDGVHPTATGSVDLAQFWANALKPIVTAPLKRLAVGASGTYIRSNGTDPAYSAILPGDLPVATTSAFGAMKPDGVTITSSDGVMSAASGSGSDHLHGLVRWAAGGGASFDLPDLAEYIQGVFDNGSMVDAATVTLSTDQTQIVFDVAPTAGHILHAQYVIARI